MSQPNGHPLRGLLVAQFLGAFNDNAWKLVVTLLGVQAVQIQGLEGMELEAESHFQTTLAFLVLTLPLMLFSIPAGVLADRLSKRSVIVAMKLMETILMLVGTCALFLQPGNQPLLLGILGCMGIQSSLFSPAKYGILPELIPHERLSAGNGMLEMWTFLAIIIGTGIGGALLAGAQQLRPGGELIWLTGATLAVLSVVGFFAARAIPYVEPAREAGGLIETNRAAWHAIRNDRILWLTVLGQTFYWSTATLIGQEVLVYSKTYLEASDVTAAVPLAVFGLGVGVGSVLAGRISGNKVEYGMIPLGAAGFALSAFLVGLLEPNFQWTTVLMVPAGIASGLIVVPLNALLQWRSPPDRRGAVIALTNVLVFAGVLVGTITAYMLAQREITVTSSLIVASVVTFAATLWALYLLPNAFLRLMLVLLTQTIYRLKVINRTAVPEKGGALLVPNHVSFADGLFLIASVDRPVRFIVDESYFHHPVLRPFMKFLGAIPISSSGGPRVVLRALREAEAYLDEGEVVCVFAEGQITRTGMLQPFRRGIERIVKGRMSPIIPVHLDRVWGSIFSYSGGRFVTKLPERIPYPVTVTFGEPLPPGTPIQRIRTAVQDLSEVAWSERTSDRRPLHHTLISRARRHPFSLMFADLYRPRLSRFGALIGSISLARALRGRWKDQKYVGIFLPSTVAAALTNVAAALSGRVSVNLNYTVGSESLASAIEQANLKTVVTSRAFFKTINPVFPESVEVVWVEECLRSTPLWDKLVAVFLATVAPKRFIEKACGAQGPILADDTVTVIFSSGSTGEPKGVMLSHANIDANVEGVAQAGRVTRGDRLLGILPLFHSFGYMALWFSSNRDLGTVFHPNPLDAGQIGDIVERYRLSILIATPTFLQLYLRRCTPAQFGSLRMVLVGAEKLSERLALAFEEQFGIRPLEGYGTTECAPAVTVSMLDFRAPGFYQPGSRRGTVGQPLPGVAIHIVDPDSYEPLEHNNAGMVLVKGPNVMQGYLGRDELTSEVMRDGWYVTGDIGMLDEDGFLKITDRLSRFSKIGGEMVPHCNVEAALQKTAGADTQVFAVTAVPDEKKGERLVVLHTFDEEAIPEIVEKLGEKGLPNLFIPRPEQFFKVDQIPVLGTGKVDLRAVKERAFAEYTSSDG